MNPVGTAGAAALLAALPVSVWGIAAYLVGVRRGDDRWAAVGHRCVWALAALTSVAAAALVYLLVTSDFRYEYVANTSARGMELVYKIGAFWGGNAGSLLFWLWMLAILSAAVVAGRHPESERLLPWVGTVLLIIALFFAVLVNFVAPPFQTLQVTPPDGKGLNPLLQNPGMLLHPIYLYLGFVGFSIPYAYAMAALLAGSAGDIWLRVTRRWTVLAWLFLSMGILYGGQWAYVELGWGGYWAWDPVENSSLMPWLLGTAFLHTAVVQEQKGMLKGWNIGLITATWLLTIFGTFLTRSGVVISVHAFANGPLGAFFLGFIGLMTVLSIYVIVDRLELLRTPHRVESLLSREAAFLLNNLLLVGITFATLWGTLLPVTSEMFSGTKVGVGPPFFNQVNVPLGIALILLMGVGPLLPWRQATWATLWEQLAVPAFTGLAAAAGLAALGVTRPLALAGLGTAAFVSATVVQEFVRGAAARRAMTGESGPVALWRLASRNRRRYGGYLVHLAVVLMVMGFTGAVYGQERTVALKPGEQVSVGSYTLTHRGVWSAPEGDRTEVFTHLAVRSGGRDLGVLRPEKVLYTYNPQPTTEAAILGRLNEDLYVVLGGWGEGGAATYQIFVNPLVAWIWIGQYLLLAGAVFALWPEPVRRSMPAGLAATAGAAETVGAPAATPGAVEG